MAGGTVNRRQLLGTAAGVLVGTAFGAAAKASAASRTGSVQEVTTYVFSGDMKLIKGPDGRYHDTFVPASFVVKAGAPVRVTIINHDDMRHSITSPALGVDLVAEPGKDVGDEVAPRATVHTFTPSKKGVYRWYCRFACDGGAGGWAMKPGYGGPSKIGFMTGYIVVI